MGSAPRDRLDHRKSQLDLPLPQLSDSETLKKLLRKHGLHAKKELGQHFLCSREVVDSIIAASTGYSGILEIGPGPGVLTGPLTQVAEKVIALELDTRMKPVLAESAPEAGIREIDALRANLPEILSDLPKPVAIVSNLPYYITSPLLGVIANARQAISAAVLMMQKEVGVRISARPGSSDRGSISVFLQACFEISEVCSVPKEAFSPPPKVESVVLKLVPRAEEYPEELFKFIRRGFASPRKTLHNNLIAARLSDSKDAPKAWLQEAELEPLVRPQVLTLEQWMRLYDVYERSSRSH